MKSWWVLPGHLISFVFALQFLRAVVEEVVTSCKKGTKAGKWETLVHL
jgi:hypothetical protein